jgi:DNA-binding MarR family transcriptional regulator
LHLAKRYRRMLEQELAPVDLTFTEWFVLQATLSLVHETNDAVNQNAVSARTEQDRNTTSRVMRALERKGLVDRGPDALGPGYRIWVTPKGERVSSKGQARFETASERFLAALPREFLHGLGAAANRARR